MKFINEVPYLTQSVLNGYKFKEENLQNSALIIFVSR
jgi:hypothetical protein